MIKTILFASMALAGAAEPFEPDMSGIHIDGSDYIELQRQIAIKVAETGIAPDSCGAQKEPATKRKAHGGCAKYYDRVAADGVLSIGVGVGYLSPISDGHNANGRFMTIVENLTSPCCPKGGRADCSPYNEKNYHPPSVKFACGFRRQNETIDVKLKDGKTYTGNYTILLKETTVPTTLGPKKVVAKIPVCLPYSSTNDPKVSFAQSAVCDAVFSQSMKLDDASIYLGHDYGSGPEFFPREHIAAVAKDLGTSNADRFFSAQALFVPNRVYRPAHKQVYMLGCNTGRHKDKIAQAKKAVGYTNDDFDYMHSNSLISIDGTETLRLIDALGSGGCEREVSLAIRGLNKEAKRGKKGEFLEMPDYDSRFLTKSNEGADNIGAITEFDTGQLFNSSR